MKVVIAPDKFKGSLAAEAVADAIAEGLLQAHSSIQIDSCPMADGGEGTVAALVAATNGKLVTRRVTGPLPQMQVDATFGLLDGGGTAVIEMSAASGLSLLRPDQYDPMHATTYGTGQLLMAAVELGVKKIILGIGGSATVDCGIGCAQACGLIEGYSVPLTAADLRKVTQINSSRIPDVQITVACDVTNPLYGPNGAARIFGPQKGATPDQENQLGDEHKALAERLGLIKLAEYPGAGTAGGLGFAMLAFFHARLLKGIDIVMEAAHLKERLQGADLCITGEGRFDQQSLSGKTTIGVARLCKSMGVACIVLAGSVESGVDASSEGVCAVYSISQSRSLDYSMRHTRQLLSEASQQIHFPAK